MSHPTPHRPPRSWLLASAAAALALALACSSTTKSTPADGGSDAGPGLVTPAFALHYHRALSDYPGWTAQVTAGANETQATAASTDGFGAVYALTVKDGASTLAFKLANGTATDAAGALTVDVSGTVREAWVFSGFAEAIGRKLPAVPGANQVAVYYARVDQNYGGWGLHTWGLATDTQWAFALSPKGIDPELGAGFVIDLKAPGGAMGNCPAGQVCIIAHSGDAKDPGPDMYWDPTKLGNIVFLSSGSTTLTTAPQKLSLIAGMGAHLATADTLVWNVTDASATSFELQYSPTASVVATAADVTGGTKIALLPAGVVSTNISDIAQYLTGFRAFTIGAADLAKVRDALKGQLVAVARKADGTISQATQVQTALAIDALYANESPLGLTFAAVAGAPTFNLWAPTAQSVKLHVFNADKTEVAGSPVAMTAGAKGVWSAAGTADWYGKLYRYELTVYHPLSSKVENPTVTDPYSTNLTTNGLYAQIIDLRDPALAPPGWSTLAKPPLAAPNDIVVYEGQIRDISALDTTVPAADRGKFLAFTHQDSDGMKHLRALAQAGLTHLHLLPVFDIATVEEDASKRVDLDQPFSALCAINSAVPAALCTQFGSTTIKAAMATFAGDSDQQQAIAGFMKASDSYNWGYDPFHYGAPEGSYASTAEGTAKIYEFRQMVQGLNAAGLRLVMDVVYNHTNAAGPSSNYSVLDKIVPGYYHRLDPSSGGVFSSSCCANTATEHRMMERLMIDTMVRWARDYKVDGFRWDLMGLHFKNDILQVRDALKALTLANDGVDGSKIYLYGEGWDMGEMQANARGFNAAQVNMAGTGVGTFNDRIRDGVRGGSPFDSGSDLVLAKAACDAYTVCGGQGFATGLFTDPNEAAVTAANPNAKNVLLADTDWVKIGMAAGLRDFVLQNSQDTVIRAEGIGYSGARSGYTAQPQEAINYVAAHDNQTLWDVSQYKLPHSTSVADRVRVQNLALDTILLGQGIPFVHLGDDLLRSKSEDKNSYDSGDWFNRVDWTMASNNWKVGLGQAGDNQGDWPFTKAVFGLANTAVAKSDITFAANHFQEMLKIRSQSPLLRLRTAADVKKRVDFLNSGKSQIPGLIVMTVTDGTCAGADLDPARDSLVVFVNADKQAHDFTISGAAGFTLHGVLQGSVDPTVQTATFSAGTFHVPARTSAVFEQVQATGAAQGTGLACNTRISI